jgi:adenosine deaminase
LKKLVDLKKTNEPDYDDSEIAKYNTFSESETLDKCFEKFKFAHDLVDSVAAVRLALSSVIDEFSRENVIYLELRSTPRETKSMTKEEYLEAICEEIM